ncbi:CMP/dCMP-type deaminase domain-containing protein [Aphelenchoides bicaudatus]|nr:CMP/dCMP-type deaminase domain-containing protein [Aphelenchoides bicaudatus]
MSSHKHYETAITIANESMQASEVPVGCILVFEGEVIGRGHNEVNKRRNSTYHAEMIAIDQVYEWCQNTRRDFDDVIAQCCLYVTLEPCCMCASGLYQLRLRRVVYGAPNDRFGGMGSVMSNEDYKHSHQIEILANVDVERSVEMLRQFYRFENPFAPPEKRKVKNKEKRQES